MHDLGKLLKELRIKNELTQEELANKLNELYNIKLNKGMISKWESNKSEPRFEYVKYMSKLYNVSLDYLLGLSKCKNKEPKIKNSSEQTLLGYFDELNDLGKRKVITYTKDLAEVSKYQNSNNGIETIAAHNDFIKHDKDELNKIKEDIDDMKNW